MRDATPLTNCRSSRNGTFGFPESSIAWPSASASLAHDGGVYQDSGTLEASPTLTKDPFQLNVPGTALRDPQSSVPCDSGRVEGTN